jgi:F-type H+-transporting ATPase subunit b
MLDFSVTFFFTLVNIGVLSVILRAILFKPVTRFMENRTLKIRGELEQASHEKAQAEELRESYEERLRKVEEEADRMTREARAEAQRQADAIIERGKVEAERLIEAARSQIEEERRSAERSFKAQAAGLVLAATGRLLRREVNGEDAERAADAFVAALGND